MENASKALIIAGAILLSILIIGLGMLVFNQAKEALSGANLDSEKAAAFNSKFLEYCGTNITGVQLKNLVDLVRDNNTTVATTENPTITLAGKSAAADLASYRNGIKNTTRYTVTATTYDTAGRITTITVTP